MDKDQSAHYIVSMKPALLFELSQSALFMGADLEPLAYLLEQGRERRADPDEVLIRRDQANETLSVVLEGSVGVRLDGVNTVVELGPGECVGELSLVDGSTASADVVVLENGARLFQVPTFLAWELVHHSHAVSHNLLKILTRRLRRGNNLVVKESLRAESLAQEAQTDALTGIYNRRWMEANFDRVIRRSVQSRVECALIFFDIDHFKRINDNLGHGVGDQVLQAVVELVQSLSRPGDLLTRFAGDEFALLLPATYLDQAFVVAKRLVSRASRDPQLQALVPEGVTLSVGVASTREALTLDSLLGAADDAMYRAKDGGRNRASL